MRLQNYLDIENWTEDDLLQLPSQENDYWEYKSSKIITAANWKDTLKDKLCNNASAFWNTGGGVFLVGVDGNGKVDGGIPNKIGRQPIRDWVDTIIREVQPTGKYAVNPIEGKTSTNSLIKPNHAVLALAFDESYDVPHMSNDKKHYIRAGAHSTEAGHYLVEAIRARRGLKQPVLKGLIRFSEIKPRVFELLIVTLNEIPALNVQINFEPLPKMYAEYIDEDVRFPLTIPIVDQRFPFRMDVAYSMGKDRLFGKEPIRLLLEYEDMSGREFAEQQMLDIYGQTSPLEIGSQFDPEDLQKAVKSIADHLGRLSNLFENLTRPQKGFD